MRLKPLFLSLSDAFDRDFEIERFGASELLLAADFAYYEDETSPLKSPMLEVMSAG